MLKSKIHKKFWYYSTNDALTPQTHEEINWEKVSIALLQTDANTLFWSCFIPWSFFQQINNKYWWYHPPNSTVNIGTTTPHSPASCQKQQLFKLQKSRIEGLASFRKAQETLLQHWHLAFWKYKSLWGTWQSWCGQTGRSGFPSCFSPFSWGLKPLTTSHPVGFVSCHSTDNKFQSFPLQKWTPRLLDHYQHASFRTCYTIVLMRNLNKGFFCFMKITRALQALQQASLQFQVS